MLFVLLIFLALAIAVDYILFSFQVLPIFAVKSPSENGTEHIGLIYVVSDYSESDPDRPLSWDWIWNRFRITRVEPDQASGVSGG